MKLFPLLCFLFVFFYTMILSADDHCEQDILRQLQCMKEDAVSTLDTLLLTPNGTIKPWENLCDHLRDQMQTLYFTGRSDPTLQPTIAACPFSVHPFMLELIQRVDSPCLFDTLLSTWQGSLSSLDPDILTYIYDDTQKHITFQSRSSLTSSPTTFSSKRWGYLLAPPQQDQQIWIRYERSSEDRNGHAGGRIEGSVGASWGGKEGLSFDMSLKGEVHDEKGNSLEASVTQNDRGEGHATLSGGCEVEDRKDER